MPLSRKMILALVVIVPVFAITPLLYPLAVQASTVNQAATCSPSSSFYNMGDILVLYINVYSAGNYDVIIYKPDGSAVQYSFGYLPVGSYSLALGSTGPPPGLRQVNLYQNGIPVSTCYYTVGQPFPPGCPPYCPTVTVTTTSTSTVPFDFTITPSTTSITIQAGQTASVAVSVQAVGTAPPQTVTLEATTSGLSPTLNPTSGLPSPAFSSTLTIPTQTSSPAGVYTITINGRSTGGTSHSASVTVTVVGATTSQTPTNCPPGYVGTPPLCQPIPPVQQCPWPYMGNQPNCTLDVVPLAILGLIVIVAIAAILFLLMRRGGPRWSGAPGWQQTTTTVAPSAPMQAPSAGQVVCFGCGRQYSSSLNVCPHCGKPR